MDITGIDKAEILCALFNMAGPQGLGWLHYTGKPLSLEDAREVLRNYSYVDYLRGRVIKVNFTGNWLDLRLFERDNGPAENRLLEALTTPDMKGTP